MLRSKIAEIDMKHNKNHMLHWAFNFQNNIFRVTNSSINYNLGLPFWMKTKCMKSNLLVYIYQGYSKRLSKYLIFYLYCPMYHILYETFFDF